MDEIKVDAASAKDWGILEKHAPDATFVSARCVLELRDRVAALEAAAGKTNPQWLGGVAVPNSDGWIVTQLQRCAAAPAGVSVEELADCLPVNAWAGPEGYSRQAFAQHLLDHPKIGRLRRGEGAAAPKRVVLADMPPAYLLPPGDRRADLAKLVCHAWAAARAEVERQQQEGRPMADRRPPKVGQVFRLAGIICDAIADSEGKTIDPITLAQRILNDPRSQWAPAQEVNRG